jgi:predicted nucleic acid-binding protein
MPVLDASFLIDLQQAHPRAVLALERLAGLPLVVPMAAAKEFVAGFDEPLAPLTSLRQHYTLAAEGVEQAVVAARTFRRMRKAGRRTTWNDATIAAYAELEGTYVVTADVRDFAAMGNQVWDYRKQPNPPA